jgi:hypothetical protein
MTHTELVTVRNARPPINSVMKAKQHIDIQNQIEAFLNKGGSVEEVNIDEPLKTFTAKEQMQSNYDKCVANGNKMDKPINPKGRIKS